MDSSNPPFQVDLFLSEPDGGKRKRIFRELVDDGEEEKVLFYATQVLGIIDNQEVHANPQKQLELGDFLNEYIAMRLKREEPEEEVIAFIEKVMATICSDLVSIPSKKALGKILSS